MSGILHNAEIWFIIICSAYPKFTLHNVLHCSPAVTACEGNSVRLLIKGNAFTENLHIIGKYSMASFPTVVVGSCAELG